MPRFVARTILVIASACWVAAGPGGSVMRALVCHDATMHADHGHMGHGRHMPADGPCFCSQMVGAFDQTVSVAVAPVIMTVLHTVSPILAAPYPSPVPLPPSQVVTPEIPPPIVA